jgi:prepilin-type processing-associated H-X9-DG protein
MDYDSGNRGNWDITYDMIKRPLWPYSGKNPAIYKCPSDKSYVTIGGVAKPRIRSMSMNFFLGAYGGTVGGFPSVQPYNIYTNLADIGGNAPSPGPAKTWVFMDVRPDTIGWGNFLTIMDGYSPSNPAQYSLEDLPGIYHNGAAGFSFADGRCEMHKWIDRRTAPPPFLNGTIPGSFASPRNPDVAWLQDHSTRPK